MKKGKLGCGAIVMTTETEDNWLIGWLSNDAQFFALFLAIWHKGGLVLHWSMPTAHLLGIWAVKRGQRSWIFSPL